MITVFLNVAASIGLSIAALFGTNERLIGENSYFSMKNNTLYARTAHVQQKQTEKETAALFAPVAFDFTAERIKKEQQSIDALLRDVNSIDISIGTSTPRHISTR